MTLATEKQRAFDYFKRLRDASLLAIGGGKDLFYAALESDEVFLTRLGRYYWSLAKEGRF